MSHRRNACSLESVTPVRVRRKFAPVNRVLWLRRPNIETHPEGNVDATRATTTLSIGSSGTTVTMTHMAVEWPEWAVFCSDPFQSQVGERRPIRSVSSAPSTAVDVGSLTPHGIALPVHNAVEANTPAGGHNALSPRFRCIEKLCRLIPTVRSAVDEQSR